MSDCKLLRNQKILADVGGNSIKDNALRQDYLMPQMDI